MCSVPFSSGPEQHRDSYWGDVCWYRDLQEQGTNQLFPMVSDTHAKQKLARVIECVGPLLKFRQEISLQLFFTE